MQVQTFNISLPKVLVVQTDKLAKKEFRSRSEVIREALKQYIISTQSWKKIFQSGKKAAKKLGIKSEADVDRMVYNFRHGGK